MQQPKSNKIAIIDLNCKKVALLIYKVEKGKDPILVSSYSAPVDMLKGIKTELTLHNDSIVQASTAIRKLFKKARKENPDKISVISTGLIAAAKNHSDILNKTQAQLGKNIHFSGNAQAAKVFLEAVLEDFVKFE